MKTRLIAFVSVLLVLCIFCGTAFAYNGSYGTVDIADGWGYDYRHNPYRWPQCTWYAWGRTYEKLGIELPSWSHARYWADSAAAAGFRVDNTPSANSIFVENWYNNDGQPDPHGHVMYIEKVENGIAYYSDSNYHGSEYSEGYFDTSTYMNYRNGRQVGYLGYYRKIIHLTDSYSEEPSFSFENYDKFYELGQDFAHFGVKIYGSTSSATHVGFELYNSAKTLLGSCQDGAYSEGGCLIHQYLIKAGSSDINLKLTPGTNYYYRYFVVANGKKYYSNYVAFQTISGDSAFRYDNYDRFYELGSNYAHFGTKIYGDYVGSVTHVGCELYNSNKTSIGTCQDGAYLQGDCLIHHYLFQAGSPDINITLTPGTNYYYRYYVVLNGTRSYSDYFSFKTLGVSYDITYDANGGAYPPAVQSVSGPGSTASAALSSVSPVRNGYLFLGWSKSKEAVTATYQPGAIYTGSENATLYAVWQQDEFIVTYDANGGSFSISADRIEIGKDYYIVNYVPTLSGHKFLGWTTELGGPAMYQSGDLLPFEGNITLYAVWSNTLSFVDYDSLREIGEDYARFGVKIYGEDIYNAFFVGCELYDGSHSLLGSCQDNAYREGSCLIHYYLFQAGSSDIDIILKPNIEYCFRYFVVVNNAKFYSDYYNFQVGQTESAEITWSTSICYPSRRNAYLTVNVNANRYGKYSTYKLLVWDQSGNLIINKQTTADDNRKSINLWYDIYTETGISLDPSTEYSYQYVATFDGYDYFSPVYIMYTKDNGSRNFGIDVSQHQGQIDWTTAAQYIDFAIIRCGFGSDYSQNDDSTWVYNVSECERLGIPYGVYLYSYAENDDEAISEAEHVIRLLAGHCPTLPVYYDLENENTVGLLSNAQILRQIELFCKKVSSAGYKTGVYADPTWWNGHLAGNSYAYNTKWLAAWDNGAYAPQAIDYAMWQYTSNGTIPGVKTRVDLNYTINYDFGTISPVVEPVLTPDFVLPTDLTMIDDEAFYGCVFVYAKLPESATKIGNRAFAYCNKLRHVYIPETTTNISASAFEGVTDLTIHGVEGSYAEFYASKYKFNFVAEGE